MFSCAGMERSFSGRYGARMSEAVLLGPGEGERVSERATIKAGRPELVVTEFRYAVGDRGPDLHIHRQHVDAFWVLEGRISVALGGDAPEVELPAGAFVLVPPEVVHTFRNPGPGVGRYLNFHAPGMGFDDYMRGDDGFDQEEPPEDGGRPAYEAILRRPGEGESLALGASQASIKSSEKEALGSLTVIDMTIAAGFPGPVLHRHAAMVDSFYVLDGTLALQLGDARREAVAGSYGFVPPGNAHTFSNPGGEPVRLLNVMAPAGLEQ